MRWLGLESPINPTFPFVPSQLGNKVSKQGLCQALKRWRFSGNLGSFPPRVGGTATANFLRHSAIYASCSGRAHWHTDKGRLSEWQCLIMSARYRQCEWRSRNREFRTLRNRRLGIIEKIFHEGNYWRSDIISFPLLLQDSPV